MSLTMDLVIGYLREFDLQNRTMAIKTIAMTNRTVIGDNNEQPYGYPSDKISLSRIGYFLRERNKASYTTY